MKKFLSVIIILLCSVEFSIAAQTIPKNIIKNTVMISARKTGEVGKNYFYCKSDNKCSTEQVVREYYKNNGYKVMRAEYNFWQGIFILIFLDELYPTEFYKSQGNHTIFTSEYFFKHRYDNLVLENKINKNTNIYKFINSQLQKHENGLYIRELDEWKFEGYKNPSEYFKSDIVQEFLKRIDNKTFSLVINRILQDKKNNMVGTPDYIIWNKKELIFVEVKRKNEKLSTEQIQWGEFLIKNKIPYKIVRVVGE